MAAADAQMYWMSAKVPNDQFLLYAFDGVPTDVDRVVAQTLARARSCPQLRLRVAESRCTPRYPVWVSGDTDAGQVLVHAGGRDWPGCLDAVTRLAHDRLDLRRMAWRLHVFTGIHGVPSPTAPSPTVPAPHPPATGPSTVVIVQIGHALGDGTRSATLAGILFGRATTLDHVASIPRDRLLRRSIAAARAQRRLEHDTAAGRVPPPAPQRPALTTNNPPAGTRILRTLVRARSELHPTVTVGVLTAIASALSDHLSARGEDTSALGAEVPMAKDGEPHAHNHFRNVGVGLYPDVASPEDRARRIGADLDDRRRRGSHPAFAVSDRAVAALPAPLLRWGVAQFDPDARSPLVIGNTVVSSINRGAKDLTFGGCPVVLTAGYPALSPMMGLTHGVHGIGDTVAISVHTAESVMPDVDDYVDRLDAALRTQVKPSDGAQKQRPQRRNLAEGRH